MDTTKPTCLPESLSSKMITVPLTEFLQVLIGEQEYTDKVSYPTAMLLQKIDIKEEMIHVEFPSKENPILKPQVWFIKWWLQDLERRERVRKESDKIRRYLNTFDEVRDSIVRRMMAMTGLTFNELSTIANGYLLNKRYELIKLAYDVEITEEEIRILEASHVNKVDLKSK